MNDIALRCQGASAREEKDEQLLVLEGLLKTVRHFFGGFSPSVPRGERS